MAAYRVFLLGAPRIESHHQTVAIDTRKALALLAYLIISGEPQSRDTAAALLWPESDQTSARAALRRTLSTLRRVLSEDVVDFGREVLTLKPSGDFWCDVTAFRSFLLECRSHGHPDGQVCTRCQAPLVEAAEIYRGDFLEGFSLRDSVGFDDWQFLQADQLRRELAGVLERLVVIYSNGEEFSTALEYARRWLSLDPLNEIAHRFLIALYALNGQRSAALRQYRDCVRILDQELGVPPLDETTQLYEDVKTNRFEQLSSFGLLTELNQQYPVETNIRSQTSAPQSLVIDRTPIIGRIPEKKQLTQSYEGIQQNGILAALTGEAGIGKTRLAHEFIANLQTHGTKILSARCYAGERNLTYNPIIELLRQGIHQYGSSKWWQGLNPHWLSEISLLLPELSDVLGDLPSPLKIDGPGRQARFYEGICQTLEALIKGTSPGVLFIDNLEWADESTLDFIAYLTRRLQGRPIFLLVSWGTESSPAINLLEQMLNNAILQGYGIRIHISPLSAEQSQELIERVVINDQKLSQGLINRIIEESDGLPYFLVEYLQAILDGEISTDLTNERWPVPSGLRIMLRSRLSRLSSTASQILQAAAVIGRTFDSDLVQSTSGRSEDEIILGIEELLSRNLIRGVPGQSTTQLKSTSYDFKHEQMRALVLEEVSLVRRKLLHRRTAEALEEKGRFNVLGTMSGQIAYHYHQAGFPEKAAEHYFLAGQMERSIHANSDALAHFQAALALGYPNKPDIFMELGDLYMLKGDYSQSIQQFEAAAAYNVPTLLPVLEQKIGQVYLRRGYWDQAAYHFEAGIGSLKNSGIEAQKALEAQIRADWSLVCHRAGQKKQAVSLAREALILAEGEKDPLALSQAHNLLGVLARSANQPELALKHLEKGLSYARESESRSAQIAAQNNLALAQADQGDHAQAIETIQGALDDCIVLGDRHLEAALRNNLADQLRACGDQEAAMAQLKEAVTIFAEIGERVEDWEPEIWKLVTW